MDLMFKLNHLLDKNKSSVKTSFVTLSLLLGFSFVSACVPDQVASSSQARKAYLFPVMVDGGDAMMQNWTKDAVNVFCQHRIWPKSIKRIKHMASAIHPNFNQPRKTQVLIAPNQDLHIHFQLGGVLMNNYSHELIIKAPSKFVCSQSPIHYEVTMQPNGDAVIYKSNPLIMTTSDHDSM